MLDKRLTLIMPMWCGMICWKWSRLTPYMGSNERFGLCPELSRVDVLNEPLIIAVVVRPIRWVRIVLARSSLSQLVLVGPDGPDHRIVSVPAPTGFVRPGWAGSSYRQLASCLEHFAQACCPIRIACLAAEMAHIVSPEPTLVCATPQLWVGGLIDFSAWLAAHPGCVVINALNEELPQLSHECWEVPGMTEVLSGVRRSYQEFSGVVRVTP